MMDRVGRGGDGVVFHFRLFGNSTVEATFKGEPIHAEEIGDEDKDIILLTKRLE